MFVPFSRIVTLLMSAVITFVLLVPFALARHAVWLAALVTLTFVAYVTVNVVLWRRFNPR